MSESRREKASGGGTKERTEGGRRSDGVHQRERERERERGRTSSLFPASGMNRWGRGAPGRTGGSFGEYGGNAGVDFQDALALSVVAPQPGWEEPDLGLPLLHVLGKNSGVSASSAHLGPTSGLFSATSLKLQASVLTSSAAGN